MLKLYIIFVFENQYVPLFLASQLPNCGCLEVLAFLDAVTPQVIDDWD
jgi:hypothetical protein